MIPFSKKILCAVSAASVMICLSGCGPTARASASEAVPQEVHVTTAPTEETTVPTTDPMELVEEVAEVMEAGELYILDHYPNLKSVDLSGSTCYEAILDYIEKHPQIAVTYTVSLGGTEVANTETAITLEPGTFDHAALLENLQFLPNLTSISLPGLDLNADEVGTIRENYPNITLNYTVELFGNSYDAAATELDLSFMKSAQVEEALPKLGLLTNLSNVYLSNSLSMGEVAQLQDSNPNATFHYDFYLFGQSLSTTDETVEYKNYNIGDDGEAQIRQALEILDNCRSFLLDNCKMSSEVLAGIREDFRDTTKVVWRVYFGEYNRYNSLTDAETLRAVYHVTDETCSEMRYCEDVKYMDIGHNEYLTDLSFIGYMPNIEVVIASGCAVTELVGFDNCKKLTWLELAYCGKLENVDSLEGCESLTYLNLSFTKVSNYIPLDGLPLQRFMCLSPKASSEERSIFQEIHTDCLTVFYGYSNPYGYGWRYDDNGKTFNAYYKDVIREAFNYDYLESLLPKD